MPEISRSPSNAPEVHGRRILLVEDEAVVSMLLEDFLAGFGCEVAGPAASLKKAIELASFETIDAALLDLNIGGEVTYAVARILAGRGIPFAFVTGYSPGWVSETYRQRPILQKPFQSEKLRDMLSAMLGQP